MRDKVEITSELNKEEILDIIKIHPAKIRNIYCFGSRCYDTYNENSDWDIKVVASALVEAEEIKGNKYNIHIHTPDKFKKDLLYHNIGALENIFAPDWAKLQVKEEYSFKLDKLKLKKSMLSTSHNSWVKAKVKFNECDFYIGTKSAFHSMRILMFGIQIAEHDRIVNFSEANHFWKEMNSFDALEWDDFRDWFLPKKIELEKKLKNI